MIRHLRVFIILPLVVGCVTAAENKILPERPESNRNSPAIEVGELANPLIDEASGLAASRNQNNLLWIINDSGNGPVVYATDTEGHDKGRIMVSDAENVDWEDLAAFTYQEKNYLLIPDVGDNFADRKDYTIYVIEEPDAAVLKVDKPVSVTTAWQMVFRYEDGPHDCESVAVDEKNGKILLASKDGAPPVLYELPLRPAGSAAPEIARRVALITGPGLTGPSSMEWFNPTAMDISRDGKTVAILSFDRVYLFTPHKSLAWTDTMAARPRYIWLPMLRQPEALAITPDKSAMYITSEKIPAPLYRIDLNK